MTPTEEWRPISGFPDCEISSLGRARTPRGFMHVRPDRHGYLEVRYSHNNRRVHWPVHVLVAEAFHGPRPAGMHTRHLNGDKLDNRAVNLTWGTRSQNELDKVEHGTHPEASRTHCLRGHEFTPDNVYVQPTRPRARHCRTCRRDREQNRDRGRNHSMAAAA